MPERISEDELEAAEATIDRLLADIPTRPEEIWRLWLWARTLEENALIAMKGIVQARTTVEEVPQIQGGPHGLQ